MTHQLNLDFGHDSPLGKTLDTIEKHNGEIESFIANGPGGNPNITLNFPTRQDAIDFINEYDGESGESDYLSSLIREI